MKAKVKNLEVEVQPMTKFDYNHQILKMQVQHTENKRVNGFIATGTDTDFGLMKMILIKYIPL